MHKPYVNVRAHLHFFVWDDLAFSSDQIVHLDIARHLRTGQKFFSVSRKSGLMDWKFVETFKRID